MNWSISSFWKPSASSVPQKVQRWMSSMQRPVPPNISSRCISEFPILNHPNFRRIIRSVWLICEFAQDPPVPFPFWSRWICESFEVTCRLWIPRAPLPAEKKNGNDPWLSAAMTTPTPIWGRHLEDQRRRPRHHPDLQEWHYVTTCRDAGNFRHLRTS